MRTYENRLGKRYSKSVCCKNTLIALNNMDIVEPADNHVVIDLNEIDNYGLTINDFPKTFQKHVENSLDESCDCIYVYEI